MSILKSKKNKTSVAMGSATSPRGWCHFFIPCTLRCPVVPAELPGNVVSGLLFEQQIMSSSVITHSLHFKWKFLTSLVSLPPTFIPLG